MGRQFRRIKYSAAITRKPITNPQMGELTMGTTTFQSSPLPCHQWSLPGIDQISTCQSLFAAARHAPQRPPTSACEELAGRPNHHVSRFHAIAASNAQIKTCDVANLG